MEKIVKNEKMNTLNVNELKNETKNYPMVHYGELGPKVSLCNLEMERLYFNLNRKIPNEFKLVKTKEIYEIHSFFGNKIIPVVSENWDHPVTYNLCVDDVCCNFPSCGRALQFIISIFYNS